MSNIAYSTAEVFSAFDSNGKATNMSMTQDGNFQITLPNTATGALNVNSGVLNLLSTAANNDFAINTGDVAASTLNLGTKDVNIITAGGRYLTQGIPLDQDMLQNSQVGLMTENSLIIADGSSHNNVHAASLVAGSGIDITNDGSTITVGADPAIYQAINFPPAGTINKALMSFDETGNITLISPNLANTMTIAVTNDAIGHLGGLNGYQIDNRLDINNGILSVNAQAINLNYSGIANCVMDVNTGNTHMTFSGAQGYDFDAPLTSQTDLVQTSMHGSTGASVEYPGFPGGSE